MLTKKKAADGRVRVAFSLSPEVAAGAVDLCGDFNDWIGKPMKRLKSGEWKLSLSLDPGRSYRFRYLLDGARWENDWAADAYEPNTFGSEDSIVSV